MYVIFPAEEVVYLTYGYQVNSALPRPSLSDPSGPTASREVLDRNSRSSISRSSRTELCSERARSELINSVPKVKSAPNTPLFGRHSSSFLKTPHENNIITISSSSKDRSSLLKLPYSRSPSRDRSPGRASPDPHLFAPDPRQQLSTIHQASAFLTPTAGQDKSPTKRRSFFSTRRNNKLVSTAGGGGGMAASNNESVLKELTHPTYNEHLKVHNSVTFKLVKTVSDFTQQLSQIYEQHAEELQLLVSNFRKRNGELRKERPACASSLFHTWETLLQEVEIDSQAHTDIASILARQVSRPLLEKSFHRKIQSRKVFTHRESYETIISKTEEKLGKCRQDYKNAYLSYLSAPTTQSLSAYFDTHNAYVQQLHATNGMLDEYHKETLPSLLQELEEIYSDLCTTLAEAVLQGAEVVSIRAMEQSRRYDGLSSQCRSVSGPSDLSNLVRALPAPPHQRPVLKRLFSPPQPPHATPDSPDGTSADPRTPDHLNEQNIPPPLKNELVVDRLSSVQIKPSYDALKKESTDLELQIKQTHDAVDTLVRMQQRSLESNLFNKVNELQEDISIKKFDLRVAQIHMAAINSQKELFASKLDANDSGRERKMSSSSAGSMKNKWLKAFKSLKTPPSSSNTSPKETDKKNQMYHAVSTIIAMRKNGAGAAAGRGGESDAHAFQEYTYKKITPCDACSQILRGHTRQGLKCRVCKMNVHVDCQDKVGKCQAKSRLLRRQKSTSEIDTRVQEHAIEDEIPDFENYIAFPKVSRQMSFKDNNRLHPQNNLDPRRPLSGPTGTSDGSMRRRLFAGMKSLTGLGSRSRQGSPNNRSISLPEKKGSTSGSGTRPFGQPLCLMVPQENGDGSENHSPPSPATKSKPPLKRTVSKTNKK